MQEVPPHEEEVNRVCPIVGDPVFTLLEEIFERVGLAKMRMDSI